MSKYIYFGGVIAILSLVIAIVAMNGHIGNLNAKIERLESEISIVKQSKASLELKIKKDNATLEQLGVSLLECLNSKDELIKDLADVDKLIDNATRVDIDADKTERVDNETVNIIVDNLNEPIGL